jgi:hypothetical protein
MAKNSNSCFSKEDIQIANNLIEKYSVPLVIMEMQIITTKYLLTNIRTAIEREREGAPSIGKFVDSLEPLWDCKIVYTHYERWYDGASKKLRMGLRAWLKW